MMIGRNNVNVNLFKDDNLQNMHFLRAYSACVCVCVIQTKSRKKPYFSKSTPNQIAREA